MIVMTIIIEYAQRATTAATLCVPTVLKVLSVFERPMRVTSVDDRCRVFFSTLFSTISKSSEDGCAQLSWGVPGGLLGSLGASRGPLGDLLGCSWGVQGLPGGVLGASWGALGAIFFGDEILIVFLIDFGTEKGAQREAFWEPKWDQNHIKPEAENKDGKKTLSRAS